MTLIQAQYILPYTSKCVNKMFPIYICPHSDKITHAQTQEMKIPNNAKKGSISIDCNGKDTFCHVLVSIMYD